MSGPGDVQGPSEPPRGPDRKGLRVPGSRTAQQGMASAYQGAVEAVLAVVISGLAGTWVDRRFGTEPTGFLVGMAIGFAAFGLRMWRMRNLMGGTNGTSAKDGTGGADGTGSTGRDGESGGPPESK